ncbi:MULTISPECIES: patatin-like phospholipase family protein [unclassified Pseudoalteromonas]|uniref:patatin-like phospholipase family protein n=1 Tax=unclassified Pseudoalteromonas TaxID=194690 RepID=UPI002358C4A3|nr:MULTISPECIES: patatin-like phospholipase family protein [unclassified Pseudoalteromonas]MDC9563994.1 patatin-like phospholipase family protein [Pseudoalteromonas sp. GAB2316C]MDC9567964.1 patatin-like phospholipase family protein [Pseudoalteromonas sp. GABNB9D]MDC9572225.1 patatin-like phospholipase family protein [Pseudoalteromonas sp. GABNS16A]MDC9577361.1 patatin-like phospholipase family protein [Pseudoalteromonas sp. GABNS16E]MDC9585150.1 patatin-like phospholipase family protein [Pseu
MIDIVAGKTAAKIINEQGFKPELFTSFLGASGGPKWFTLFGLDKYIFGEFFKNRTQPLNLIGSSAGAFRSACFAQNDPVAAIERLAKSYSQTRYTSNKPTLAEITLKARALLDDVFGEHGVTEILNNPIFKAHFIVAKSNGFIASENKLIQLLGLSKSYMLNRVNRKLLGSQYERFIFGAPNSNLSITDSYNFKTQNIPLSQTNLKDALLASGSIPLVMQGVKNIAGSPQGMYRDGGIIDYHFDLKINNPGLILYPHFNSEPKAGWFDKSLKRKVAPQNYDNVVMISPSKKFVAGLPYGKIPDRSDFTKLDADTRIKYWNTVFSETEKLAEDFDKKLKTRTYY